MAHSLSYCVAKPCSKSGVKATCRLNAGTSQFDPLQTSDVSKYSTFDGPQPLPSTDSTRLHFRIPSLGQLFASRIFSFFAHGALHDFVRHHAPWNDRWSCGRSKRGRCNPVGNIYRARACSIRAKDVHSGARRFLRGLVLASRFGQAREARS